MRTELAGRYRVEKSYVVGHWFGSCILGRMCHWRHLRHHDLRERLRLLVLLLNCSWLRCSSDLLDLDCWRLRCFRWRWIHDIYQSSAHAGRCHDDGLLTGSRQNGSPASCQLFQEFWRGCLLPPVPLYLERPNKVSLSSVEFR